MKMCACGQKSVTGLKKGVALCQHEINVMCYGKKRAKQIQHNVSLIGGVK